MSVSPHPTARNDSALAPSDQQRLEFARYLLRLGDCTDTLPGMTCRRCASPLHFELWATVYTAQVGNTSDPLHCTNCGLCNCDNGPLGGAA